MEKIEKFLTNSQIKYVGIRKERFEVPQRRCDKSSSEHLVNFPLPSLKIENSYNIQ